LTTEPGRWALKTGRMQDIISEMPKFSNFIIYLLLPASLLSACAPALDDKPPELYWPFPPQKPRVKFVDYIIGSHDVLPPRTTLSRIRRFLFGEEAEVVFQKPIFVTVRDDVLYVTDINAIHVYDFKKKKFRLVGLGVLSNATGIAVAKGGKIFVGDSGLKKVFVFDPEKKTVSVLGGPGAFERPAGIALDEAGRRLVVVDAKRHNVTVWNLDGELLFTIGKPGKKDGEFNFPFGAAVDAQGRIYVADAGNFRVQAFDGDGKFLGAFGGVGAVAGTFARPKGIALDSEGHIYVVDASFGNFQIFAPNGLVLLAVGSNGSEPGKFLLPAGIFIDENDKIYVVDQINRRVQIFQYLKEL